MISNSDLDRFRDDWKHELNHDIPAEKKIKIEQSPDFHFDLKEAASFNNIEYARNTPNTFKPFLIAEKLLSGQDVNDSNSESTDLNHKHDKLHNKASNLEEKKVNESFLDIFLRDLVCC